jgi:hypothetical protein|tara:strand:+ start:382 stop:600 length:219 start_codon:yes stop_codon:yes gene_type:complete
LEKKKTDSAYLKIQPGDEKVPVVIDDYGKVLNATYKHGKYMEQGVKYGGVSDLTASISKKGYVFTHGETQIT